MSIVLIAGAFNLACVFMGWLLATGGDPSHRLLNRINAQTAILKDLPEHVGGRDVLERAIADDLRSLDSVRFPPAPDGESILFRRSFRPVLKYGFPGWMFGWFALAYFLYSQLPGHVRSDGPDHVWSRDGLLTLGFEASAFIGLVPIVWFLWASRRETLRYKARDRERAARRARARSPQGTKPPDHH